MASTSSLRQSLRSLAQAWPTDKLRPAIQFSAAIDKASQRIFYAEPTAEGAERREIDLSEVQKRKAQQTVQSLERLLNNSASKYPLSSRTLNPPSFPKHYARMRDAIERAGRGEIAKGPSWSERFFVWR
ncbi:hypothetical protein BCR35DRAFT_88966 [Leucosporidium creatinivorum]|uniref:Uncharacterized protein n=1 Tax=Leucosporidium creatinivorum TaxID=106004 RepID=A0A1Y2F9V4_9BASI|nr:hypothetical protein BCR35DRAFT_88966 [Leucosporidium creatinivorum]